LSLCFFTLNDLQSKHHLDNA
jgi:hypothetical protein